MGNWSRRAVLCGAASLAACGRGVQSTRGEIATRVDAGLEELFSTVPGTREISQQAAGMLIMPRINEGGFIYGASYGEGALRIKGATVDYYAVASASVGLQIGAQRYGHALFFMTPDALAEFRTSDGWELGVDAEFAVADRTGAASITSGTYNKPIYAIIYGQQGLIVGATIEGNKYSRIVR